MRDERTLDDELPQQGAAPAAERAADGELAPAVDGAGEEQVGDVDAAEQQYDHGRAEKEERAAASSSAV